jgi:hypothetical protein
MPSAAALSRVWPDLPPSWAGRALAALTYWLAISLGFVGLHSLLGTPGVMLTGAIFTPAFILARASAKRPATKALRWAARLLTLPVIVFFVYECLAFGWMLTWAIPALAWLALATSVAALAWSELREGAGRPVPRLAPMGLWVLFCLLSWQEENATVRCEDVQRSLAQTDVRLVAPSDERLEGCTAGERLRPRGHPRKLFSGPQGDYFLSTGGFCRFSPGTPQPIACNEDELGVYAALPHPTREEVVLGGGAGFFRVKGAPPFERLSEADPGVMVSTLIPQPRSEGREFVAFFDEMDHGARFDSSTLEQRESKTLPIAPEEVRYDSVRGEGLMCFASTPLLTIDGQAYLGLAYTDDPLRPRLLGATTPWARLAFSDGCDLDTAARRAYIGVGTLGLLAVVDYDSGEVERTHFVGFGPRPVLLHSDRKRIYLANYLDGSLSERDVESGRELRRWFVGRFVRHLVEAPGGESLYVTSTMGILEVAL